MLCCILRHLDLLLYLSANSKNLFLLSFEIPCPTINTRISSISLLFSKTEQILAATLATNASFVVYTIFNFPLLLKTILYNCVVNTYLTKSQLSKQVPLLSKGVVFWDNITVLPNEQDSLSFQQKQ